MQDEVPSVGQEVASVLDQLMSLGVMLPQLVDDVQAAGVVPKRVMVNPWQ
jgi:hypothetical protein